MFSTPGNKIGENHVPYVFHVDDIAGDYISEVHLGRKGVSLSNLHSFDVPVPEFFVISPKVFTDFVKRVFEEKKDELLRDENPEPREISNLFQRFDFDNQVKSELLREYTKLSGFSDAWVSVRSSVYYNLSKEVSFSDVFATELNVRGFNNVIRSIKNIYASLFTDEAVMYAVREGVELSDVSLAVVIQKMVHSEISGTCFTVDPVTLNTAQMSMEAVFGLGDVIANGEITPDTYYLHKKNLEVYEKHISPQEWMKVRSLNEKGGFEKIKISPSWSHRQKLEDRYVEEVAKICLLIEDKLGDSVDVEWVLSGGRVWILQYKAAYSKMSYMTHHVQYGGYAFVANSVGAVIKEMLGRKLEVESMAAKALMEAQKLVEKEAVASDLLSVKEEVKPEKPAVKVFAGGIGASFGENQGKVHLVMNALDSVTKDEILVMKEFDSSLADLVIKSGGVISEVGGITSEVAILCREFSIPAIVGVTQASEHLKSGDIVKIDGTSGSVYLINQARVEEIAVAQQIQSKKAEQEFVTALPESKMAQVVQTTPVLPKSATKVFVTPKKLEILPEYSMGDGVVMVDIDKVITDFGKHPADIAVSGKYKTYAPEVVTPLVTLAQSAGTNEVIVTLGMGKVSDFRDLPKGNEYESEESRASSRGVGRYLKSKKSLDVVLRLVRRMRNINHCRNISLALYAPQNGMQMKELKKDISSRGLRRGSSFNLYAVVENPAEVILADDILDAEIDGIILDTPTLAKHMFNLPLEGKNSIYDLSAGSILKIVDALNGSVKHRGKKFIVLCEDNKELLKHSVSIGAYGVAVSHDYLVDAKQLVVEQEAKIILSLS